jgi:hypothetical protein
MFQNGNRTQDMPENRPMFGNGPLTHESVYDHQILLNNFFFLWILFLYLGLGGGHSQMLIDGKSCL